jgi:endoglycosylceramidase
MGKNPLTIKNNFFYDAFGRQVILHGIGLVDKNPKTKYLAYNDPAIFRKFREWGFNCVRLGILWAGLEPQPVILNEEYLKGIDQMIAYAQQNGLYVFLDMHQDLYSVKFSDGAPSWATLTDDQPHINVSDVWSDAYFTSPAVQAALDNFWNNSPAVDRVGLQDHFAAVWGNVAKRYANNPTVIGYDIFNEPQPGTIAAHAQGVMFAKGAEVLAASGLLDKQLAALPENTDPVEALMHLWLSPEGRFMILEILKDMELYQPIIDAQQPFYNQFEKDKLMTMYTRVAQAIRKVDPVSFLFLETTMASNMGVYTAIEPVQNEHGQTDPNQVYAPHGYDLVTDTPNLKAASSERVELIFNRHQESAKRLNMPWLVGEWGAFGNQEGTLEPAWHVVSLFEQMQCGETFWAYFDGVENTPSFNAIQRPYPMKINGKLTSYHYDPEAEKFTCHWMEYGKSNQPTYIYLPDWFDSSIRKISLSPEPTYKLHAVTSGSKNTILEIPPTGKTNARRLTVS